MKSALEFGVDASDTFQVAATRRGRSADVKSVTAKRFPVVLQLLQYVEAALIEWVTSKSIE